MERKTVIQKLRRKYKRIYAGMALSVVFALLASTEARGQNIFHYEKPMPLAGKDIPGPALRAADYAAYYAFQFGPGSNDVLYLVFDCERKYGRHDIMFLYSPEHELYSNAVLCRGSYSKSRKIEFRKFNLHAKFDKIEVDYNIKLSLKTMWEKGRLNLDSEIICRVRNLANGDKCSFELYGSHRPVMLAFRKIEVEPILKKPTLHVSWDYRSDPPHVRGRIKMGKFGFLPDSGLSSRAKVVISSDVRKSQTRKVVKIETDEAKVDFICKPPRKLRNARAYTAEVKVDLTPFFGILMDDVTTVLR